MKKILFKENKSFEIFGKTIGYLFAYFLFTTILFFALTVLNKIPESWTYLQIGYITMAISAIGAYLNWYLK